MKNNYVMILYLLYTSNRGKHTYTKSYYNFSCFCTKALVFFCDTYELLEQNELLSFQINTYLFKIDTYFKINNTYLNT
jgi:hypothetical protein